MPAAIEPRLISGRVYRTQDLRRYSRNPTRLAKRLVAQGKLQQLGQGVYARPEPSKFGPVPASDVELMRAFLRGSEFLLTGPDRWNALGLGSTALFPAQLVYNRKRTGDVILGGRHFVLRRVQFPDKPTPEYFAVDLIKNHRTVGVSLSEIERHLAQAVTSGRLNPVRLRQNSRRYGTKGVERIVEHAIESGA